MGAGVPVQKQDVDNRAGGLVVTLRDTLDACNRFKAYLDSVNDAFLTGLGYSAADITLLRNSFTDLANLYATAHGTRTQAALSDFFFNAKNLTGVV